MLTSFFNTFACFASCLSLANSCFGPTPERSSATFSNSRTFSCSSASTLAASASLRVLGVDGISPMGPCALSPTAAAVVPLTEPAPSLSPCDAGLGDVTEAKDSVWVATGKARMSLPVSATPSSFMSLCTVSRADKSSHDFTKEAPESDSDPDVWSSSDS